ncbi:hypothetical protein ES708_33869 [subsurface metagenome]
MAGITLIKSDWLTPLAATTEVVEVDLGLGIDEAARILGVSLTVAVGTIFTAPMYALIEAAYSFDPEDIVITRTDDEIFAYVAVATSDLAASTGAQKQSEAIFLDFTQMNVVTTRNLAFLVAAVGLTGEGVGRVYYEKYKPTQIDLVQLIAQRR